MTARYTTAGLARLIRGYGREVPVAGGGVSRAGEGTDRRPIDSSDRRNRSDRWRDHSQLDARRTGGLASADTETYRDEDNDRDKRGERTVHMVPLP